MRQTALFLTCFALAVAIAACSKDKKNGDANKCFPGSVTARTITNQKATVWLNDSVIGVNLTEDGTIDTRLIPCNLPRELYIHGLKVIISGEVKTGEPSPTQIAGIENFVITSIKKQ